ncbi:MAG TPA: patatin-like phospholipase family protein [Thermoanaerobaculia bacterium]|nr:patatin-like phospholipase family protein [Thermoanaerobaculia bacterium]
MARPSFCRPWLLTSALALGPLFLQGCATTPRRDAVPEDLQTQANVVGFPSGIRYFPRDAGHVEEFERDYLDSLDREIHYRYNQGEEGPLPPAAFLAISGGGDNGAFGAGLLYGWTEAGTRPEFKLVTGVSTGALIAPFAFLGPAYDERLKALYTGISMKDIAEQRSILSILYGDAMADNTPLWNLVKKYVTQEMLDAIAAEHEKGRILLVATTNLDVRRPVIWNVTKIAATKLPGALALIQKILIASAAIPGTFPPTMIDVEAGAKTYQEMHVDGGTAAQVFVYPAAIHLAKLAQRERKVYIIRNARLDPEWAQVDRRTLPIAFRAITCLIQYQGLGDLYRIYAITQRDHVDYNLAFIPATFDTPHTSEFDTTYMRALFDLGYRMAAEGHEWWYKRPPVLVSGVDEEPPAY